MPTPAELIKKHFDNLKVSLTIDRRAGEPDERYEDFFRRVPHVLSSRLARTVLAEHTRREFQAEEDKAFLRRVEVAFFQRFGDSSGQT